MAKYYVTTDKKFIKEFDSQSRELIISSTQLFWKVTSLVSYKVEGMEDYKKLAEVKEDYFYFLVARELARNVYTMKQFLMIDELVTRVNELETKTIAYLNSMLEDTELKYSQLELALEYSFINNNSLEEEELWNEALRVLYE